MLAMVFGLGATELLLIGAIALIVIGPKKLPQLASSIGKAFGELRGATNEFKREFARAQEEIREDIQADIHEPKETRQPHPRREVHAGPGSHEPDKRSQKAAPTNLDAACEIAPTAEDGRATPSQETAAGDTPTEESPAAPTPEAAVGDTRTEESPAAPTPEAATADSRTVPRKSPEDSGDGAKDGPVTS